MGDRYYVYGNTEVWIIEKITQLDNPLYGYPFELRRFKYDGTVDVLYLDYVDGISTININRMKKMEV